MGGKGKKKVSKGGGASKDDEVAGMESLSISETPSTSGTQPAEEEEEGGLTGAAKRRKKKELKRADKDAKKQEAAEKSKESTPAPETSKETTPAPEVSQEIQSPAAVTTATTSEIKEKPKEEVEEECTGLGLQGTKRKPRKKKPSAAKAPATAGPTAAAPVPVEASTGIASPGVAFPWGAPKVSPAAASGPPPIQQTEPGKTVVSQWGPPPAQSSWTQLPPAPSAGTSSSSGFGDHAKAPPTRTPTAAPSQGYPRQEAGPMVRPTRSEAACRYRIPKKIIGNQAPAFPVTVLTNYLPMTIKSMKIYRYDVTFKPDRPKKLLGKAFTLSKNKHFPKHVIAFDQIKNGYSLNELKEVPPNDRYCTNVELKDQNGKMISFEVSYKYTGMVDLNTIIEYMKTGGTSLSPPTEAIQCIDVILRQGTLESYVKAGRQFFKRPARPIDLGDGLEMWTGLFQSGIFTSRAFVNIDVAHKGFPKQQPLVNALQDFRLDPRRSLDTQRGRGNEMFQIYLKGLRVMAMVGGDQTDRGMKREFICNGIVGACNRETFCFEHPNGKKEMMTVMQYFERVKRVRIRYPELNCVWVGPRDKTIFYPMELLEVAYGQAQNKQLNDNQLATMVRQAATPPDQRKQKIEEVIQSMNYSGNEYFKKFGLEISNKFFEVKAKVLKPPRLEVGGGMSMEPRRGVWQSNKVYKAEALQSWGFIAIEVDPTRCDLENTIRMMMNVGRSMGMNVSEPVMRHFNVRMEDLQSILLTALEREIRFLFVVVSARGRDYYHRVKKMAERDVGILTQCLKENTTQGNRMNQQTAKNILLKVNSKLMGINQVLDVRCLPRCLREGGVMVVGADVTHPSPDQSNIPSIAAVTASIDTKCFVYNIGLSIQTPKKEMIVEFEDMMLEHLQLYRKNQRALPRKIFVFRDGVSEGQFAQVMNSELQAVHNAYRTIGGPNAKPEVLFLLVQKRHHTRLFVPNSANNVDPGTVVDEHIVHASELDFYLVSHHAIKGTARPTRYHAVCNDGQIPHDEVEQLTYYLCHLYSRCMRAVSYPTPTYYAHLACLRARSLTHGEKFDNKELERHPKRLRVMDKILQYSRMFFV